MPATCPMAHSAHHTAKHDQHLRLSCGFWVFPPCRGLCAHVSLCVEVSTCVGSYVSLLTCTGCVHVYAHLCACPFVHKDELVWVFVHVCESVCPCVHACMLMCIHRCRCVPVCVNEDVGVCLCSVYICRCGHAQSLSLHPECTPSAHFCTCL